MPTITRKTVLITGCSDGGLGAALAIAFTKRGFHVFATLRNPAKASSLTDNPDIEILPMEVTSSSSIASCAATVEKKTNGKLDVLVNNAGMMFIMPLLDTDIEASKKLFDVNVWGPLMVTQAFAPMLIRSKGVILNIASVAGAMRMAWQGIYNSSKASARWISETLRIEMQGLGVRVITAMLGEVKTKILDHNTNSPSLPTSSCYTAIKDLIFRQGSDQMQSAAEKAEITAENLVRDVLSGRDGHVWRGGSAGKAKYLHWMLPERVFERMLHSSIGVYNVKSPF